jgi:3-methyl-2-oxobutanoate hydroxymethyltransferase
MDLAALRGMKRAGEKIVGVVVWDYQMAQIVDRAGVDLVSVGDSVGVNLWGGKEGEITLEEMLVVCKAVRRGVTRALLSCDLPPRFANAQNARRLVEEGGAQMIKVEAPASVVKALADAGISIFAEFHGGRPVDELVKEAKDLEAAGAALLDFRHSGPDAGAAVVRAVSIPVLGGLGGGPWLDGRMRMAHAAIGYGANFLESKTETYANVARVTLEALSSYAEDVRAARQIKGGIPVKPAA